MHNYELYVNMHCLAGDWVSGAVCEYLATYLATHYKSNKEVQLAFLFECIRIRPSNNVMHTV